MNTQIAIRTLDALASGMDPVTGEAFPEASPYNRPVVLRSLFVALKALQQPESQSATAWSQTDTAEPAVGMPEEFAAAAAVAKTESAMTEAEASTAPATAKAESSTAPAKKAKAPKTPRVPPANAGKAWTPEEDEQLCHEFDSGVAVKELAVKHSRSAAALNARLFKLGKIADPGFPLRMRPSA